MGAVEHLKTLCCLGLKPKSAMIAVTPLLHEIIPHGWARIMMLVGSGNPPRAPLDFCGYHQDRLCHPRSNPEKDRG